MVFAGVALAFVAGFAVPCALGLYRSARQAPQEYRDVLWLALKVTVASLAVGWIGAGICEGLRRLFDPAGITGTLALFSSMLTAGLVGGALLAIVLLFLRVKEAELLFAFPIKGLRRHFDVPEE